MKRNNKIYIFISSLFILVGCFSFLNSYIKAETFNELELFCNSNIAMDFDSGNILYDHNGMNKIYPASTTKILTCILALENSDLTDTTIVSNNVIQNTPIDSSVMGVKAGQLYTMEELLYGLMLPSGNDAALVIAESISGSVEKFVELMNEKLKILGCKNTNFVNPHGYHDINHYSTAYDMSIIFRYCLRNDTFRKIINTDKIEVKAANSDETLKLINSNRLQNPNYPNVYYKYIQGGKTGYTIEARGTFIGYAIKNEKTVIVSCFDGSQNINGQQARYIDAKKLFDFSFDNYNKQIIVNSNEYKFKVFDQKNSKCYTIKLDKDIYGLIEKFPNVCYTLNIDYNKLNEIKDLQDNTQNNTIVGNINFEYDFKNNNNNTLNTYNLILTDVSSLYTHTYIKKFIPFMIIICSVLLIILIIIYIKMKSNKTKLYF